MWHWPLGMLLMRFELMPNQCGIGLLVCCCFLFLLTKSFSHRFLSVQIKSDLVSTWSQHHFIGPQWKFTVFFASSCSCMTTAQCFRIWIACTLLLWSIELPGTNTIGFHSLSKRSELLVFNSWQTLRTCTLFSVICPMIR